MADLSLPANAIIAIGDIHGCDVALRRLLAILLPLSSRVVFLGDYVDRGPSSIRVIEQLLDAKRKKENWVFLVGNHELMLRENSDLRIPSIGENTAYDQYAAIGGQPQAHREFFDDLRLYHETLNFLFVHAGPGADVHPDTPFSQRSAEELCWTYRVHSDWTGKTIVRGHVVVGEPSRGRNHIDLDTGCYQRRWLSAGILDDETGKAIGAVQVSFDGNDVRMVSVIERREL